MSVTEKVLAFVKEIVEEIDEDSEVSVHSELSLLKSGLFDSNSVLTLAVWIEEETGRDIELSELDLPELWDTPALIVAFIENNR